MLGGNGLDDMVVHANGRETDNRQIEANWTWLATIDILDQFAITINKQQHQLDFDGLIKEQ